MLRRSSAPKVPLPPHFCSLPKLKAVFIYPILIWSDDAGNRVAASRIFVKLRMFESFFCFPPLLLRLNPSIATCWVAFYVWMRGEDDTATFFPTWIFMDFAFPCSVHLFFLFIFPFFGGKYQVACTGDGVGAVIRQKDFFPLAFVMLVKFPPFFFLHSSLIPLAVCQMGKETKENPQKREGEFKFQIGRRAVAAAAVSYKNSRKILDNKSFPHFLYSKKAKQRNIHFLHLRVGKCRAYFDVSSGIFLPNNITVRYSREGENWPLVRYFHSFFCCTNKLVCVLYGKSKGLSLSFSPHQSSTKRERGTSLSLSPVFPLFFLLPLFLPKAKRGGANFPVSLSSVDGWEGGIAESWIGPVF